VEGAVGHFLLQLARGAGDPSKAEIAARVAEAVENLKVPVRRAKEETVEERLHDQVMSFAEPERDNMSEGADQNMFRDPIKCTFHTPTTPSIHPLLRLWAPGLPPSRPSQWSRILSASIPRMSRRRIGWLRCWTTLSLLCRCACLPTDLRMPSFSPSVVVRKCCSAHTRPQVRGPQFDHDNGKVTAVPVPLNLSP
jgi:hypothetical protein